MIELHSRKFAWTWIPGTERYDEDGFLHAFDLPKTRHTYNVLHDAKVNRTTPFMIYGTSKDKGEAFAKTMRRHGFQSVHFLGGYLPYGKDILEGCAMLEDVKCVSSRRKQACGYESTAWQCYEARNAPEGAVPMPEFCRDWFQFPTSVRDRPMLSWCPPSTTEKWETSSGYERQREVDGKVENVCFRRSIVEDKFRRFIGV